MDMVSQFFLKFLERQERKGRVIPEVLLDAREEILAPEAEPAPIPAPPPAPEISHDVVSDMSWNSAIEGLRAVLSDGNHPAVYNYELSGSAFQGLTGAIDRLVASGYPRAPFDALLTAIDSLNGRSGDWTTVRAYQVGLNRVIIRDETNAS